jgi:hypothetical protein
MRIVHPDVADGFCRLGNVNPLATPAASRRRIGVEFSSGRNQEQCEEIDTHHPGLIVLGR